MYTDVTALSLSLSLSVPLSPLNRAPTVRATNRSTNRRRIATQRAISRSPFNLVRGNAIHAMRLQKCIATLGGAMCDTLLHRSTLNARLRALASMMRTSSRARFFCSILRYLSLCCWAHTFAMHLLYCIIKLYVRVCVYVE